MTGKRKAKKTDMGEKQPEKTKCAPGPDAQEDGAAVNPRTFSKRLDVLGESVADLFSRMDKIEKMFEALTSSAPIEPKETKTEIDMRDYEVREGQTMSMIAKEVYGNAGLFNRIAAHNYDRYPELRENANEVKESWRLRIPPAP